MIGVLFSGLGWRPLFGQDSSSDLSGSSINQKPYIWSFPEACDSGVPVKSNIIRLSIPVSSGKRIDYVGCAESLVRHVQREYGAGSPALIFFVIQLNDTQSQDLFAQEISRSFPDSAVVGISVPCFFTRDGMATGPQAAIWYLGGADIRVSSVVVPFDSVQGDSVQDDTVQGDTDQKPLKKGADLFRIERQARLALRTRKDAAALIFYRDTESDSPLSGWIESWTSGLYFEDVPTFCVPLSKGQTDSLYFGSVRYSHAMIELIISGTISAEIKSLADLASNESPVDYASFAFCGMAFKTNEKSTIRLTMSERELLEKRVEFMQNRLGKLTPMVIFPDPYDKYEASDKCLILSPLLRDRL